MVSPFETNREYCRPDGIRGWHRATFRDDQMTAFEGKIEVVHELHRIGALTREQLERLIEPPRQELHKLKFSESSQAT